MVQYIIDRMPNTDVKQPYYIFKIRLTKEQNRMNREVLEENKLVFRLTNPKTFKALPIIMFIKEMRGMR